MKPLNGYGFNSLNTILKLIKIRFKKNLLYYTLIMPTKDRKDKFARHRALVRKQGDRYMPHWYNDDEKAKQVYNNVDFSLCNLGRYERRYSGKWCRLYKSEYIRLVNKYVNRYVRLNEIDGYGIILSFEDGDYLGSIIEDADYDPEYESNWELVNDKKAYMECNIFDIFNPKIQYENINIAKINDYLLNKKEIVKIDTFIKEYYDNNKPTVPIKEYKNNECPICLEDYSTNKRKHITLCGHRFHDTCFKKWNNIYCPLCNQLATNDAFNNIYKN